MARVAPRAEGLSQTTHGVLLMSAIWTDVTGVFLDEIPQMGVLSTAGLQSCPCTGNSSSDVSSISSPPHFTRLHYPVATNEPKQ